MHSAPSVSYPVGRSRVWGLTLALVWLAGALLTLAWWTQVDRPGWRQWLALTCVLVGGAVATTRWRASPTGVLHWDGAGWQWRGPGSCATLATGLLAVHLDLQRCLLVHLRCDGGERRSRWLWLEQRRVPGHWGDLRRAVYSRAAAEAAPSPD